MKKVQLILITFLLCMSPQAYSWETKQGKVIRIQVNSPQTSARNIVVWLENISEMCDLPTNFDSGYFNKSDLPDTFESFVSALLTAKAAQREVLVLTTPATSGCKIERIELL